MPAVAEGTLRGISRGGEGVYRGAKSCIVLLHVEGGTSGLQERVFACNCICVFVRVCVETRADDVMGTIKVAQNNVATPLEYI